ncbi:protease HtpX [Inmirania thermothiophila]|nr:protease HtpX [Inmirania thermothiophila]
MKRVMLFLGTNVAVLLVMSVSLRLLGVDRILEQGAGIDFEALLVFAALLGMGGSFISLALSKWTAIHMMGLRVIEEPADATEAWLVETVGRLAREAGIGTPDVAVYEGAEMNAFATGMDRDHALVAVSTGLLRGMRPEEVEAVLGHEVSHIANGDMVTLALIQGVVNTFVIVLSRVVGHVIDRVVLRNERGYGPGFFVATLVAQVVLGILASIIVFWFSRRREFRADAGGARLAGRAPMIAALRRLAAQHEAEPLPDQLAAFGISGRVGQGLARLFMTHPPIEERIAALEAMA